MAPFAFAITATRGQVLSYLLGVALFSISFLVFLNSSISFVITERIGQKTQVGDAVGTLGFADEIVALVACPLWGILSDRVGVRAVAVTGYVIVGVALALLVMSRNVYPDLLLGRLLFSVGGAATATMVTAILPTMTLPPPGPPEATRPLSSHANGHNVTPSISSELTITPARYSNSSDPAHRESTENDPDVSTSQLAGLVGMFTGLGALLALLVFLPLPARFQQGGTSASDAVTYSFWVVAAVAIAVALICLIGLRNLPGEQNKSWRKLFGKGKQDDKHPEVVEDTKPQLSYFTSLSTSCMLGFKDVNIGLAYLGGFVARASSVAISLFIPLFVNAYFIRSGICDPDPNDPGTPSGPGEIKQQCARAYVVAAKLTGTSQLVALICAPVFGYLSGRYPRFNVPLLLAAFSGIAGYAAFGALKSPDPASEDGSAGVYFIVALLGISQIGAIVCSLGQLGRGIQGGAVIEEADNDTADGDTIRSTTNYATIPNDPAPVQRAVNNAGPAVPPNRRDSVAPQETSTLLPSHVRQISAPPNSSRAQLKGSIAGLYSLAGGVGILLLTKAGGLMFDRLDVGAPFWLMAAFNGVLFVASVVCGVAELARPRWDQWDGSLEPEEDEGGVTRGGHG